MKSVAFVSSAADADFVVSLKNNSGRWPKIICNFPPAFRLLSKHGIQAVDSQVYISTNGRSYPDYQKIVRQTQDLSKLLPFGDILGYSLILYLGEIRHSFLVAQEILRREKPQTIFLSTKFTESPMKTYQSGNLNCENVALFELAKNQGIQITPINQHQTSDSLKLAGAVGKQLLGDFVYSIKQLTAARKELSVPPILFLANHYQLGNLIPTIQSFMKNNQPLLVVGKVDGKLLQSITGHKIPFVNYYSQLPRKTRLPNLKLILTLKYLFTWLKHQRILRQKLGLDEYWPPIRLKLFYYYMVLIPQIIETLNFANSLFDQHPRVMLTTATNDVFSKCFALSAKQRGTKVIEIQHGLLILDVDAPFRCNDIYAVWGKDVIPLLNQTPIPQNPKIVGYPYAVDPPSQRQQKLLAASGRQKLGISSNEKVILVLGAFPITVTRFFSPVSTLGFINLLIDGIDATGEKWTVIIRPHPSYDPKWITDLPTPKSIKLILDPRQVPLNEVVAAADIVIANHTTTILEPLIQKKPLLLYLFLQPTIRGLKSHPLITSGIAPLFHTADELTNLLNKISTDNYDQFLSGYFSLPAKVTAARKLIDLCDRSRRIRVLQ